MVAQVVHGVLVAAENVVRESVDLDVTTDGQLSGSDELVALVNVLVLITAKEGSLDNAGVLDCGLKDRDAIVSQVERNDEATLDVLRDTCVESGSVTKDLLVIVY